MIAHGEPEGRDIVNGEQVPIARERFLPLVAGGLPNVPSADDSFQKR